MPKPSESLIKFIVKKMEGMSQRELAQKSKLSQSKISRVLAGEADPYLHEVQAIFDALGSHPSEFFSAGHGELVADEVNDRLARIESMILNNQEPSLSNKEAQGLFTKYRHIIERLEKGSALDLEIVEEALGLSPSDRASDSETA